MVVRQAPMAGRTLVQPYRSDETVRQERERPVGALRYDNTARRRIEKIGEQRKREWTETTRIKLTLG